METFGWAGRSIWELGLEKVHDVAEAGRALLSQQISMDEGLPWKSLLFISADPEHEVTPGAGEAQLQGDADGRSVFPEKSRGAAGVALEHPPGPAALESQQSSSGAEFPLGFSGAAALASPPELQEGSESPWPGSRCGTKAALAQIALGKEISKRAPEPAGRDWQPRAEQGRA